jgi:hypothetical protein
LVYLRDPSIVCGKDFNSLSQKSGARTELATKQKDGMAKIASLFIRARSKYNGSSHNIHIYVYYLYLQIIPPSFNL